MPAITELRAKQARIIGAAKERLKLINETTDESRARALEAEHDADMAEFDKLRDEICDAERASMRPNHGDAFGCGVNYGEFGPDGPLPAPYALRHGQSMVEHLTRNAPPADQYCGLTEGAFLRSMILGPATEIERRALAAGADASGGITVPVELSARLIDRMRAQSVVFQAGAQALPLTSDHHVIARVASDPAPAWRMENAAVMQSEPTFDAVRLVPRSLAVLVKVSRELLEDSLNLETALPDIMAAAMAVELDRVALLGTGTAPQPRGIANFAGLTASGFAGGALTYGALVRARTALRSANMEMGAIVLHPRDEGNLAALTDTTGQPLATPPALSAIPMLTTTALPVNLGNGGDESLVLAGDFSRLLIGVRSSIRIEVSRELFSENLQVGFLAHARIDIAAEHNAAFTKLEGVTA